MTFEISKIISIAKIRPISSSPPPQTTTLLHLTFKLTIIYSHIYNLTVILCPGLCRKLRSHRKRQRYDKFIHDFKNKSSSLHNGTIMDNVCEKEEEETKRRHLPNTEHFNPDNAKLLMPMGRFSPALFWC